MARVRVLSAAVACGVVLFACSDDPFGPRSQRFSWSGTFAPGEQLEIKGVNGHVIAMRANGPVADVSVLKSGRHDDPAAVRIEVVEHAGGVTICAVYPDVPGDPPNECAPGDAGRLSARDNDVRVTFTIEVPAGVDYTVQTVNGAIEAEGLESDISATTVNGSIRLATTAIATASAVNGSITATIGSTDWDRDLSFATVNGDVSVEIPAGANAEAELITVNGNASCEFALHRASHRHLSGRIGAGGHRVMLSSVNGNVRLRRGP